MADPLVSRTSRLRSLVTNAPTAEDMAAENALQTTAMSPVSRGFAAGGYGMTAGSFANDALDARLAGEDEQARYLEQQAAAAAQQAAQVAPRVSSLRQINDLGDAGTFVGGQLGQAAATMAPVLAAAALTRGRAMPRATAFLGAAIPAYQLERNEAVLNQQLDPETAGMDPQRRAELARNKGVVNAALESLVPAGLAGTFGRSGRSALRTFGSALGEEGLTESAQEATGILAQETLRRGSLAQAVPELATPDSLMQIADAGAAGAIGGGGMSLPTVGSQVAANAIDASAKATKAGGAAALEAGKDLVDKGKELADKTGSLREWADETLKGYAPEELSDEDAVAELNRHTAPPRVVPEDETEQEVVAAVNSGDPDRVQAAMAAREANQPTLRARAAQALITDEQAPEPLRAMAQRVLDGSANQEETAQILGHAAGYQASRAAKFLAARGVVALDDAISFGKEQLKALREQGDAKQNAMEPGEEPALVEALFNELKPEFRTDTKVRSKLTPLIQLFRRLDGAEPTRETYELMQRLAPATDMFQDVSKVLPKGLAEAFSNANRAQLEAGKADSWLSQNLTPAFQKAEPGARAALGRLIDRAAVTREEPDAREMALLTRAFGSKGAARTMLRHYKLQTPLLKSTKPQVEEQEDQALDENDVGDAPDRPLSEREGEFQYHYAGSNRQSFLNLRKQGERAPAQAKARELREAGDRAEIVSLAELAREKGVPLEQEAARLRADFAARNETGRASLEEQVLHEAFANDDHGLLKAHQVVRTSARDNADDKMLQAHKLKSQPLVRQARNPKADPKARAAARSTLFTVRRADGEELTLSAESLWKQFGDRVRELKTDRGVREGESQSDAARVQDLFAQAVAELALDPEVTEIDLPDNLVLDRTSGQTLAEDQRLETKEFKGKRRPKTEKGRAARARDEAAALQALTDNEFSKRAKELANNTDRSVAARLDALAEVAHPDLEGIKGPRRAYLTRRAEMARDAMLDLVNKLVPPPATNQATGVAEVEGMADAEGSARRAYQAQERYAEDLRELVGDYPEFDSLIARAEAKLEELEEAINPPREFDETTGLATIPGTKEAAANASGVKEMARQAQKDMDAGAPDGIAVPTPTKINGKTGESRVRNDQRVETPEFNKLPAHDPTKKTMTYAGVGSRQTPPEIMAKFRAVAKRLEQLGYTLNTGDAEGADRAFRNAVDKKNVFTAADATDTTRAIAKEIHPNPQAISRSSYVLNLQARNTNQVFGRNLDTPVDFVLVWTKDGSETQRGQGGTGQAMEMALRKGIPVVNAATPGWEQRLKEIIEAKPERRQVSDLQQRPRPEKTLQAKPVTPAEAARRKAQEEADRSKNQQAARERAAARRAARTKNNDMDISFDEDDFDLVEVNGSGDSSASLEAIHRLRDEKEAGQTRLLIERDGSVRELTGVDAVDTHARAGQIILQRNVGRNEWTVLSHGADVPPTLIEGRINAARYYHKFSTQSRKRNGIGISRELKNEIAAEIKRITGVQKVRKHLFFVKASEIGGASGQYTPAQRAIKIAISSVDPLGVAYHEALHDFIAGLQDSEQGRKLRVDLFRAGEMPHIRAQLKTLLKDHPNALAAIETDAEERIAYLFQFWAVGQHLGKPVISVRSPEAANALGKLARWIRGLLGVVSQDEKAEAVLEALYDGRFADRNIVAAVIQDLKLDTLRDKAERLAGPLADVYDKLMLVATDRLRKFGVDPLDELADMFATEPGREKGGLRFLQRRAQRAAQFDNRKAALFNKSTAAERATALRNLQAMKAPSSPLEREVRSLLDDLHAYMTEAGVQRFDPKSKTWVDLPKVKNYFPRRWDPSKILRNEAKFKALLQQHGGVSPDQQAKIVQALTHGDGQIELADSEYHVGYTPFAAAVQDRQLSFINEANAADFVEFQNGDLADALTGYIYQATHRAEFARDFGNAGELIQEKLNEAATKLDGKQLAEASNAIKGLVGTLGADVNPRLKDLMSAAVTAQNVILLPLTMFSQFIDALGVGLRAQAPEEAWNAFKRGMKDFAGAVRKRGDDYDAQMAKTLGLIDEQNMLEAMGQAHAGAFMSQTARNINSKFFRWNGMESWNRSMRISAMVAGERFIQREIGNERYMRELNLEPSDVMVKPDGRLAVTAEQMIALGASKKQAAAREKKIQEALFRFVDGAVLRPNAAQRPVWGSDPHWMLVFHLKQFAFSFQKTILARVNNEFEHGKLMPAAILAAYVPVTMASGLAKAALTGQPIGDGSMLSLLNYGVMRSGVLGAGGFGADAFSDLERGLLPGTSLIGPTMEHAWMASRYVVGDPEIDAGRILDRSLPFARYF